MLLGLGLKTVLFGRGYSQNFLVDHTVSQQIAFEAGIEPEDAIFEIGPGLTAALQPYLSQLE